MTDDDVSFDSVDFLCPWMHTTLAAGHVRFFGRVWKSESESERASMDVSSFLWVTLACAAFFVWFHGFSFSALASRSSSSSAPRDGYEEKIVDPLQRTVREGLRPFVRRDAHRVRRILEELRAFSRRYVRLLKKPKKRGGKGSTRMARAYERLYDDHVRLLNLAHELYLSGNQTTAADAALTDVVRVVQSHTSRMLRVLRHKYPAELRAVRNNSVPVAFYGGDGGGPHGDPFV